MRGLKDKTFLIAGGATGIGALPHDIVEAASSNNQTPLARANPRSKMRPLGRSNL